MNKKHLISLLYSAVFVALITSVASLNVITSSFIRAPGGSFNVADFPPVIESSDFIGDAGDLVTIYANATDPNGNNVTITFGSPLNSSGQWQSALNDSGIFYTSILASDGTTQSIYTAAIKLRPYCGDNSCDSNVSESCSTCSADCGVCPSTDTGDDGAGAGGGRSGGGGSYPTRYKTEGSDDFETEREEIYIELQKGESLTQKLEIKNHLGDDLFLRIGLIGAAADSIKLDLESIAIPYYSGRTLDLFTLNLLVSGNKPVGTYKGELTLESDNTHKVIPITLVITPGIFDIAIELLTPEIDLGQKLKLRININKSSSAPQGQENIYLRYLITGFGEISSNFLAGATVIDINKLDNQIKGMIYQEETVLLVDAVSFSREIEIPVDFIAGDYVLNINAKFDGKDIPLSVNFSVGLPWYAEKLFNIEKGIIAIIITIIALLFVILVLLDLRSKRSH